MARVLNLFRSPKKRLPMEELPEASVVADSGFYGCAHARPGGRGNDRERNCGGRRRRVYLGLLHAEHPSGRGFGGMGELAAPARSRRGGEHITTDGLNVNGLKAGEQLQIGEVRLEVSAVCTPCDQLEKVRSGLRKELWGRRGMLCRVVTGGMIHRGDPIERVSTARVNPSLKH